MQYLKRNTKYSIFTFLVIVLPITVSIFTLAKTEVYSACACTHADRFSLYDNSPKEIIKNINQAQAFINIAIYAFLPPAQKIFTLRDLPSGWLKELEILTQLYEITSLEWKEWRKLEKEGTINREILFNPIYY